MQGLGRYRLRLRVRREVALEEQLSLHTFLHLTSCLHNRVLGFWIRNLRLCAVNHMPHVRSWRRDLGLATVLDRPCLLFDVFPSSSCLCNSGGQQHSRESHTFTQHFPNGHRHEKDLPTPRTSTMPWRRQPATMQTPLNDTSVQTLPDSRLLSDTS